MRDVEVAAALLPAACLPPVTADGEELQDARWFPAAWLRAALSGAVPCPQADSGLLPGAPWAASAACDRTNNCAVVTENRLKALLSLVSQLGSLQSLTLDSNGGTNSCLSAGWPGMCWRPCPEDALHRQDRVSACSGSAEGEAAGAFSIPGPHSLAHREISGWLASRAAPDAPAQQRTLCPVRAPPPF